MRDFNIILNSCILNIRVFKKKFLLLTVLTGLTFGSCNIYPGLLSWIFGKSLPVKTIRVRNVSVRAAKRVSSSRSILFGFFNIAAFSTIIVAPVLLYAYFNKDSKIGKLLDNFLGNIFVNKINSRTDTSGTDTSGTDTSGIDTSGKKNIEEYIDLDLTEYIKDNDGKKFYKKIDNVEYMQLKTINQSDDKVISSLKQKYNSTISNGVGDNNFNPGATCGSQAIRNAYFLSRAFSSQDKDDKQNMFKAMSDNDNAKINLERSIERGEFTSDLERADIAKRISKIDLQDGSKRKLGDSVSLVDSVIMLESGVIDNVIANFRNMNNYYHVFIVNTCDSIAAGFDDFMEQVKITLKYDGFDIKKIDKKAIDDFRKDNNGGHWYVVAIEKRGQKVRCIVVDSGGSNLVSSDNVDERAQFLCEYILNGKSKINFKENLIAKVAQMFKDRIK